MAEPTVAQLEPAAPESPAQPGNLEPGDKPWYSEEALGLSSETQDSSFVKRQPDLETALKSLDHQGRTLSGKLTSIPTDESSEDDWSTFHNQLGRPEKMEDYDSAIMVKGEDGKEVAQEWNKAQQEVIDRLKKLSYNTGLSNRMFKTMFAAVLAEEQETYESNNSPESAEKVLKESWGKDYAENSAKAMQGWKSLPEPIQQTLMALPLAARHQVSSHIAGLSQEAPIDSGSVATTQRSLEAVNIEINSMLAGTHEYYGDAMRNRVNPKHKEADGAYLKLIEERGRIL